MFHSLPFHKSKLKWRKLCIGLYLLPLTQPSKTSNLHKHLFYSDVATSGTPFYSPLASPSMVCKLPFRERAHTILWRARIFCMSGEITNIMFYTMLSLPNGVTAWSATLANFTTVFLKFLNLLIYYFLCFCLSGCLAVWLCLSLFKFILN